MMVWAILLIVGVAAVAMLSYIWEELDREQRYEWSQKMEALKDAVKQARIRKVK